MRAHQEDVVKARERQIAVNAGQTSHLEVDKNRKKKKGAGSAKQVLPAGWTDLSISLITLHGAFAWGQYPRKCSRNQPLKSVWKFHSWNEWLFLRGQWVKWCEINSINLIQLIGWLWMFKFDFAFTRWGWEKIAAISQTTFSNAFSSMKMYELRLIFHWSLFLRVQFTI